MANNVGISTGTGATVATDQLADLSHVQLFKLLDGTEDGTGRIGGSAAYGLDVDVIRFAPALTINSILNTVPVAGDVAQSGVDSGNPVKVGGFAASALPTAVSNADRANILTDLWGRVLISHIDPGMQIWKQVEGTTQATGSFIWQPASGKRVAITSYQIGTGGTTAGTMTIWFGAAADGTFTQGTDQTVFRGEFAPSTTARPGVVMPLAQPIYAATADHILRITTSAALSFYITVYGYEF